MTNKRNRGRPEHMLRWEWESSSQWTDCLPAETAPTWLKDCRKVKSRWGHGFYSYHQAGLATVSSPVTLYATHSRRYNFHWHRYNTCFVYLLLLVLCRRQVPTTSSRSVLCTRFQFTVAEPGVSLCHNPVKHFHPRLSLVLLPSIFDSSTVLSNEFLPSMWPIQFLCLSRIVSISDLCSPTIVSTWSFIICSVQLIFSIFHQIHISNASSLLTSSFLRVHISDAYIHIPV